MYKLILVPVDGSLTSKLALAEAVNIARMSSAAIQLLHIVEAPNSNFETPATYFRDVLPAYKQAAEKLLRELQADVEAEGVRAECIVQTSQNSGVPTLIVEQAKTAGVDLIVMGTQGRRGLNRMFMGSAAEQVSRTAPVPLMLVRPKEGLTTK